ncbi:MAG: hypothetical protein HON55_05040 [Legionellales bacterium]|nr:hypothetical protein [Legionellales bacterium]
MPPENSNPSTPIQPPVTQQDQGTPVEYYQIPNLADHMEQVGAFDNAPISPAVHGAPDVYVTPPNMQGGYIPASNEYQTPINQQDVYPAHPGHNLLAAFGAAADTPQTPINQQDVYPAPNVYQTPIIIQGGYIVPPHVGQNLLAAFDAAAFTPPHVGQNLLAAFNAITNTPMTPFNIQGEYIAAPHGPMTPLHLLAEFNATPDTPHMPITPTNKRAELTSAPNACKRRRVAAAGGGVTGFTQRDLSADGSRTSSGQGISSWLASSSSVCLSLAKGENEIVLEVCHEPVTSAQMHGLPEITPVSSSGSSESSGNTTPFDLTDSSSSEDASLDYSESDGGYSSDTPSIN